MWSKLLMPLQNAKCRRLLAWGSGIYAVSMLVLASVVALWGDQAWPATLLLYAPRWPWGLPAVLLLAAAASARHRVSVLLSASALAAVAGPFMGFNLPFASWFLSASQGPTLRIVTFNAGRTETLERLERFLGEVEPDLVVIPECTYLEAQEGMVGGLHARRTHGVCVLSRFPFLEFDVRHPRDIWQLGGAGDISLARVQTPFGPIALLALHLETVREGLTGLVRFRSPRPLIEVTELRRHESALARKHAQRVDVPLIVAGDLNMPVESQIYNRFWSHLSNAFSDCGFGYGHTKRTRWYGMRIDHVLFDGRFNCLSARLGPDLGSDHLPLIVDVRVSPNRVPH